MRSCIKILSLLAVSLSFAVHSSDAVPSPKKGRRRAKTTLSTLGLRTFSEDKFDLKNTLDISFFSATRKNQFSCSAPESSPSKKGKKGPQAAEKLKNLSLLNDILWDEGLREHLVFFYPEYFTSVEQLFEQLIIISGHHPELIPFISEVLSGFEREDFPLGIDEAGVDAMIKLAEKIQAKAILPELLDRKYSLNKGRLHRSASTSHELHKMTFSLKYNEWKHFQAMDIADALTKRDELPFSKISLSIVYAWLKDETSAPEVQECEAYFAKTVNWLAYQLVREEEVDKRMLLVEKILELATQFWSRQNLHGLIQISEALNKREVAPLLDWKNRSTLKKDFEALHVDINEAIDAFNSVAGLMNAKDSCLPNITGLLREIKTLFQNKPKKIVEIYAWLRDFGAAMSRLHRFKELAHYDFDAPSEATRYFSSIEQIPDDVIKETALIHYANASPRVRSASNKNAFNWTSSEVVSFFFERGMHKIARKLLLDGIWSGEKLYDLWYNSPDMDERITELVISGLSEEEAKDIELFMSLEFGKT